MTASVVTGKFALATKQDLRAGGSVKENTVADVAMKQERDTDGNFPIELPPVMGRTGGPTRRSSRGGWTPKEVSLSCTRGTAAGERVLT